MNIEILSLVLFTVMALALGSFLFVMGNRALDALSKFLDDVFGVI